MKRTLKVLGILLGLAAIVIGGFAAFIALRGIPDYDPQMPEAVASLKVAPDSTRIERGAKIATLLCNECHKSPDGRLIYRSENNANSLKFSLLNQQLPPGAYVVKVYSRKVHSLQLIIQ